MDIRFSATTAIAPPGSVSGSSASPAANLPSARWFPHAHVQLPQVRQTCTVLASQPEDCWGYQHGLNEHQLAVGCSTWSSQVNLPQPGLAGTELVRLLLRALP